MSVHVLERRQTLAAARETVFRFFEDPLNLEAITPPWLHFEVVSATDPRVREGTEITYRLRWQIIPMSWRSRIIEYDRSSGFVDEMLKGPYARWSHRHEFTSVAEGVEMVDRVEYALPFGPLGDLVHAAVVRAQLESIFDYRRHRIAKLFPSTTVEVPT